MPAHEELRLLTKIIDTGSIREIIDAGVLADHFRVPECRALYKLILGYYQGRETKGYIPTRDYVEARMPGIALAPEDRREIQAVLADFQDSRIRDELRNLALYLGESYQQDDPSKLIDEANRVIKRLGESRRNSKDVLVSDVIADALHRYHATRSSELRGIPYPWALLNAETQGINNGEFIVLYGRPKSLKTWVLLKVATHAYDHASCRVLVYTREMTLQQMVDRCLCLMIGAPYSAYKKGLLNEIPVPEGGTMEDRLHDFLDTIKQDEEVCAMETGRNKALIITSDREVGGGGTTGLERKIEDHKPDLVCVDAVYLMRNDKANRRSIKWEDQSEITIDLKDMALNTNRPLVITTQANRASEGQRGLSTANIAFADAYGMNCDLAMEIGKRPIDAEHSELALSITGAREINLTGFAIHGNPGSDFNVLMRQARNEDGVLLTDEDGSPLMEPTIFQEQGDIAEFFKDTDARRSDARAKRKNFSEMAKAMFASSRRR